MNAKLLVGMFALLLAAPAAAGSRESRSPDIRRDTHPPITETMGGPGTFDCSAGGPASLLVVLAATGLLLRRRSA